MPKDNADLKWLEGLREQAKALKAEEAAATQKIRDGFVDRAIVFMDVVGSTQFKVDHKDHPEKWILRVQQFSELMASAARSCHGRVIKFIGDEIMVSFASPLDAQNFVSRASEIEEQLSAATGYPTRVKVAADFGHVYELSFDGHDAPDPQGLPVDRCARIGKFTPAGEVLASAPFVEKTPKLGWTKVGSAEMKGLGKQLVFQLGKATVDLEPVVEVSRREHDALVESDAELRAKTTRLEEQNRTLQEQLKHAGQQPDPEASVRSGEDEESVSAWEPVDDALKALKGLIDGVPSDRYNFARFVFLYHSGKRGMPYDKFEGRAFDVLIDAKLVVEPRGASGGYYKLNPTHLRNKKIIETLAEADKALARYLADHEQNSKDMFAWSLDDPEFWKTYIGFSVF